MNLLMDNGMYCVDTLTAALMTLATFGIASLFLLAAFAGICKRVR